jgi:hypothetical protein
MNSIAQTIEVPACWMLYAKGTGFQSGKSTTDRLFAMRKIIEKGNEFNIQTHHIFIDFKAA